MNSHINKIYNDTLIKSITLSLLAEGYCVRFPVKGTSMYPYIRDGDIIFIKKIPLINLQPGQVIVYEYDKNWIAHRIVVIKKNKENYSIVCKGDSRFKRDSEVNPQQIIAVVTKIERKHSIIEIKKYSVFQKYLITLFYPLYSFFTFKIKNLIKRCTSSQKITDLP